MDKPVENQKIESILIVNDEWLIKKKNGLPCGPFPRSTFTI
jgi:hypothetical protein